MKIEILSQRRYGEPKLKTPKELKGIPKAGTVPFGSKCSCPAYITDSHIYLKHRDFFSPCITLQQAKDAGIIDKWNKRFIYNDTFGGVVLRCEAWLRISKQLITQWQGLLPQYGLCIAMAQAVNLQEDALFNYGWEHMFEELIKIHKSYELDKD
jgi:hypothetical protein